MNAFYSSIDILLTTFQSVLNYQPMILC